ncbi:MAG TPA: TetR/AcrR family transcriptional regulator [Acidimicrobiales bacterium]|nr:TetR/AcrR family transcriptional regulator [Acidimicrobiales bacterium]
MTRYDAIVDEEREATVFDLPAPSSLVGFPDETRRLTLRDDNRHLARARILQGALSAVVARGLSATVDEVAIAAGVSRRTVFRHFKSHNDLILATMFEMRLRIEERVPDLPQSGDDVEAWLLSTATTIHALFRDVIGRAFWDVHDRPAGLSDEVARRIEGALEFRTHYATILATGAWHALGGEDEPPAWVVEAFSLNLSGFVPNALPTSTVEETASLSARLMWLALQSALDEQPPSSSTR